MNDISYRTLSDVETVAQLDEIAELYVDVYAEPPYNGGEKYSREAFLERTRQQIISPGFTLVTATAQRDLLGFTFGFQMGPNAWWKNSYAPPLDVLRAPKFAVIELVVDAHHRGHGIGRELLDRLLACRYEEYARLAGGQPVRYATILRRYGPATGRTLTFPNRPL
jgi:GNAT superfamily N-acetyltransferase